MTHRIFRLATLHWRGQIALWPTLLLTLLGLRAVLASLTTHMPSGWPLVPVVLLILASLAVLIWQVVGGLRALRVSGADGSATAAGVAAVLITVALFLNSGLNQFAARAAPAPLVEARVLPLPVDSHGRITLHGEIGFALYERFTATLLAHPDTRLVDLQSDGGQIYAARALAAAIGARNLDTMTNGLCASACTLVFMAGKRRSLGPQGALGFHGYSVNLPASLHPTAPEEARDRAFLAERGVAAEFLDRAYGTPHDALWRPSLAEMQAAGLITPPG